jgi:GDP-L-fucose synthase
MNHNKKILVTGHSGMIGSAVVRLLIQRNHHLVLTPSHAELDLRDQAKVMAYFEHHLPEYVFHLAAVVGGIYANATYPAQFIYDNTQMHCNIIEASARFKVTKLLFPGSACTYPKLAPQPIKETAFLDGLIETTNIAYAAAKINGIIMCQAYARQHQLNVVVPMPTNTYGINDNFNPEESHVIPALMRRLHEAKMQSLPEIVLWGTGTPLREFIYADDLADGLIFLMENYNSPEIINIGTMQEVSMIDLAHALADIVQFKGKIVVDTTKPDGAPRKCLDSSRLFSLGWKPKVSLKTGLQKMYEHHF